MWQSLNMSACTCRIILTSEIQPRTLDWGSTYGTCLWQHTHLITSGSVQRSNASTPPRPQQLTTAPRSGSWPPSPPVQPRTTSSRYPYSYSTCASSSCKRSSATSSTSSSDTAPSTTGSPSPPSSDSATCGTANGTSR